MTDEPQNETLDVSALESIERVCNSFEAGWKRRQRPRIEEYLANALVHKSDSGS